VIRRVAFRKAILAGTIGAMGWEVVVRLLTALGVPLGDLVRFLGTMITGDSTALVWWPAGLALHASAVRSGRSFMRTSSGPPSIGPRLFRARFLTVSHCKPDRRRQSVRDSSVRQTIGIKTVVALLIARRTQARDLHW
jgi:hypothetical protein